MSRVGVGVGILLCISAVADGACTTSRPDGSARIETTSEAKQDNLQGAVTAPLRDVNLLRTKIPPVLLSAMADAYEAPAALATLQNPEACALVEALIAPLDDALGPDLDEPQETRSLRLRGERAAYGAMAEAASDVIPFRGWVRKLTGAERHDHLVQDAIRAGSVRRAYLKGLGEARGCKAPSAPIHLAVEPEAPTQSFLPRYPIR